MFHHVKTNLRTKLKWKIHKNKFYLTNDLGLDKLIFSEEKKKILLKTSWPFSIHFTALTGVCLYSATVCLFRGRLFSCSCWHIDTKLVDSQFFTLLIFSLYRHSQYSEHFYLWGPKWFFGPIKFLRFLHIIRLFSSSSLLKKVYLFKSVYLLVCLCWYSEGSEISSFHINVSVKYGKALKLCWHPQHFMAD